jgi:hypothetical protein
MAAQGSVMAMAIIFQSASPLKKVRRRGNGLGGWDKRIGLKGLER